METQIVNRPDQQQYEISLEGKLLGKLRYREVNGHIDLYSTHIEPSARGKGLASVLAKYALDDARENGRTILPTCPFVAQYIQSHPEYKTLLVRLDA